MRSSASPSLPDRGRLRPALLALLVVAAAMVPARATGSGDSLEFTVVPGPVGYGAGAQGDANPPAVPPADPAVGIGGHPQSLPGTIAVSTRMADFAVTDASGSGRGWSITVSGERGLGLSPVLRQYCPSPRCGPHPGPAYVRDGTALPPHSLTLDSSGASFDAGTPGAGRPPSNSCDHVCFIDARAATPSKVAVAEPGAGMGAFEARGFAKDSFRVVRSRPSGSLSRAELFRVDVSWSLNTGP